MRILLTLLILYFPSCTLAWFATKIDTVEILYPDGKIRELYQQVLWEGNETTTRHGFYRSWYENGRMESEGQYDHDNKINTWIRWDTAGWKVEEISYLNGEKHGTEVEYNPNGTARKILHYRNGELHGECTWYKEISTINEIYNHAWQMIEKQHFYIEGVPVIVGRWDHLGHNERLPCVSIRRVEDYNAEQNLWYEIGKDCEDFYVGRKADGKKQGLWILYTPAGDMKRIDVYDKGELLRFFP